MTIALIATAIASTVCLLFIIFCQHITLRDYERQLAKKPIGRMSKSTHTAMLQMARDLYEYHSDQYTKTRIGFLITKLEGIDG